MSKSMNSELRGETFSFPRPNDLWNHGVGKPRALGCQACIHLKTCGGLHVGAGIYDCQELCRCSNPSQCDNVCPYNSKHMVARVREIGGFNLVVPKAPQVPVYTLPTSIPMLYHSSSRSRAPAVSTVALSLYDVIEKQDGTLRFATRDALVEHFKLAPDTSIILSGTDDDAPLERWWKLPNPQNVVHSLKALGVQLITGPNFSLFTDVPRTDNLYNMKRIGIVWSHVQGGELACALHLNGRTDRDWQRWTEFLKEHDEIRYVAFEFATGARSRTRIGEYVDQLRKVAQSVEQPLHLIMRGGIRKIGVLAEVFEAVTVVDTRAFIKAQKRQRGALAKKGLKWNKSPTAPGESIDELLDANILAVDSYVAREMQEHH